MNEDLDLTIFFDEHPKFRSHVRYVEEIDDFAITAECAEALADWCERRGVPAEKCRYLREMVQTASRVLNYRRN